MCVRAWVCVCVRVCVCVCVCPREHVYAHVRGVCACVCVKLCMRVMHTRQCDYSYLQVLPKQVCQALPKV